MLLSVCLTLRRFCCLVLCDVLLCAGLYAPYALGCLFLFLRRSDRQPLKARGKLMIAASIVLSVVAVVPISVTYALSYTAYCFVHLFVPFICTFAAGTWFRHFSETCVVWCVQCFRCGQCHILCACHNSRLVGAERCAYIGLLFV